MVAGRPILSTAAPMVATRERQVARHAPGHLAFSGYSTRSEWLGGKLYVGVNGSLGFLLGKPLAEICLLAGGAWPGAQHLDDVPAVLRLHRIADLPDFEG